MNPTALQEKLHSKTVAEYRSSVVAARYGDPVAEYATLASGCGVYDLGFRARLSVTGADRVRWMNGMVTNNVRDLAAGHGVYAFLLNPQGRILGDMYIFNHGDSLTVQTDRNQVEKILATFDHYIIMDDVQVENVSDQWTALGLTGPDARTRLRTAGIDFAELEPLQSATPQCACDCDCLECTVVRSDTAESYELWLAPNDVEKTWKALLAAGASPVGSEALEMFRIAYGTPLYGTDIRERDLPQETEQARALNFNKGCYIGQEIVERIRSRGNVHRKFAGLATDGAARIAAGTKITIDGKDIGEVTSAATVGTQTIALGYIRREMSAPGRDVMLGEVKAKVVQLPLAGAGISAAEHASLQKA